MRTLRALALAGAVLAAFALLPAAASARQPLMVYGPGGPHAAISECAEAFAKSSGVQVVVQKGEPDKQAAQVARDGDVYYTGAEYMLEEFTAANPGLLDEASAVLVAPRRIGIILRAGNPRGVRSLADLARPGLRILDVRLENMGALRGPANANVAASVTTGEQGFNAWQANPDLDAWVTYRTWSRRLGGDEFLPVDGPEGLRHAPAALTRRTTQRETAAAFLRFLASPQARDILRRHGFD